MTIGDRPVGRAGRRSSPPTRWTGDYGPTTARGPFPWIERVFADAGDAADRVAAATRIVVEIVRKHPDRVGLAVHPRRWVVERFSARLGRNRRLAKDVEATLASATAFLHAASVLLLIRRLAPAA